MNPRTHLNNLPNPNAISTPELTRDEINEWVKNEKQRRELKSYRQEVRSRLDNLLTIIEASLTLYLQTKQSKTK